MDVGELGTMAAMTDAGARFMLRATD